MQTHVCRTRIGPQRCCHGTDQHPRNTKNRRLFWFSEQTGNTGRKWKSLQANLKMSLFFWTKNCPPQKTTQKQFCMELLKFKAEKGWSTPSMPSLLWHSMARFALRTPKFLTYINSWDQKGCIQMYWGSQPLSMQEHLQSQFKGCSHRRRSEVTKKKKKFLKAGRVLISELDCRPPETPFQPKSFYENILVSLVARSLYFHWLGKEIILE